MTVLMKGDPDLRAAFLFKMCDAQSNGAVERRDLLWVLNSSDNEQGKQVKLQELQRLTEKLFDQREQSGWTGEQPRVNLKQFQEWSVRYRDQSLLLKWLMSAPLGSFIRTPIEAQAPGARGTAPSGAHFDAIEIDGLHDLYSRVRQSSISGKLDQSAFESLFCHAEPGTLRLSPELARALFSAFDEHGDGEVDVNEFICGLSATCRGSIEASLEFCLSIRTEAVAGGEASYTKATLFNIVNSYLKLTGTLQTVAGITSHLPPEARSSLSEASTPTKQQQQKEIEMDGPDSVSVPELVLLPRGSSAPAVVTVNRASTPPRVSMAEDGDGSGRASEAWGSPVLERTKTAHIDPHAYGGEKVQFKPSSCIFQYEIHHF